PTGAILFYTIPGLNEVQYTASFPMSRDETLSIRASPAIGTYGFLRWEGPDGIIGTNETVTGMSLPSTGATAAYNAVYAATGDLLTITMTQTGGAGATLSYILNGVDYLYSAPFTVRKSADSVSISASSYGSFDGVRWQDDIGNILSLTPVSGNLNLSVYGSAVTITAVFAAPGDRVIVTLSSEPAGAVLFYTISGLNEVQYTTSFPMSRSETLSVRASATNGTYDFLRWEIPGGSIVGTSEVVTSMSLPSTGTTATYKAVYVAPGDRIIVTLASEPAVAVLFYTIPGLSETQYTVPIPMSRSETLSVRTSATAGVYDFQQWEDSGGTIVGTIPVVTGLSLPLSGNTETFTAYFTTSAEYQITADSGPHGSISPSGVISVLPGGSQMFNFVPDSGYTVNAVYIDGIRISGTPNSYTFQNVNGDHTIRVEFSVRQYRITATSDAGSTISPSGQVNVQRGSDQMFSFSAADGYVITAVIVDGVYLSQERVDLGYYTFNNVAANHSIEVKSETADITLIIDLMEGKGYAEYSVDGSEFVRYYDVITLPGGSDIVVRAVADKGYEFSRWVTPYVETTPQISFQNVFGPLHLELYFSGSGSSSDPAISISEMFIIILLIVLLAAGLLIFVIFYRRSYDVIKVGHSEAIIGKDKARRKKAYRFSIEGAPSGTVSYRVGEDGMWKTITPDSGGEYVIPKEDVIDKLTIEHR
ncbi:MAG: hypothetical protein FWG96_02120, partial [Methanomassiliicoccaceae archaeon]|nr:hypothetical protein [Methanomassiliicoccaceae archaeon]